jgi:uncharacterized phage protein gp47/JayE
MSYLAPYVGPEGLVIPSYQDILDNLIEQKKAIYGSDIYLEIDSSDYQELSVFALMLYDTLQAIQLVYNNRGPLTGVGSGLDQIVACNGISRREATYSTCTVTLTGTTGTIITNGIVTDTNGNAWNLPATVTLVAGTASAVATCQTIGAITAAIGTLTSISTPVSGWTSVTNAAAATAGLPVETDAELRARQVISVEKPSMTLLTGTWAALLAVDNVTRINVLENPTNDVDEDGLPAHSISCVVEGGTTLDIATAIWENKGIGPLTNPEEGSPEEEGAVHQEIVDPISSIASTINFYRPSYVSITVALEVTGFAGYTAVTTTAIKTAIFDYLNDLQIGENLTISAL